MEQVATDGAGDRTLAIVANADYREALLAERDRALARLRALEEDVGAIVQSAEGSNGDDEHDPEGATIAFERERTVALRAATRAHLDRLGSALWTLETGTYGTCLVCGREIPAERLLALPGTQSCVECSAAATGKPGPL